MFHRQHKQNGWQWLPWIVFHVATCERRSVPLFGVFPLAAEQCAGRRGCVAGWKGRLTANKLAVAKISRLLPAGDNPVSPPEWLACFSRSARVSAQVTRERMLLSKKKSEKQRKKLYFPFALHLISKVESTHISRNKKKTNSDFVFWLQECLRLEAKTIAGFCCVTLKAM